MLDDLRRPSDPDFGRPEPPGGVAERLKAPVLKTGKGLVLFAGSNPAPTVAKSPLRMQGALRLAHLGDSSAETVRKRKPPPGRTGRGCGSDEGCPHADVLDQSAQLDGPHALSM